MEPSGSTVSDDLGYYHIIDEVFDDYEVFEELNPQIFRNSRLGYELFDPESYPEPSTGQFQPYRKHSPEELKDKVLEFYQEVEEKVRHDLDKSLLKGFNDAIMGVYHPFETSSPDRYHLGMDIWKTYYDSNDLDVVGDDLLFTEYHRILTFASENKLRGNVCSEVIAPMGNANIDTENWSSFAQSMSRMSQRDLMNLKIRFPMLPEKRIYCLFQQMIDEMDHLFHLEMSRVDTFCSTHYIDFADVQGFAKTDLCQDNFMANSRSDKSGVYYCSLQDKLQRKPVSGEKKNPEFSKPEDERKGLVGSAAMLIKKMRYCADAPFMDPIIKKSSFFLGNLPIHLSNLPVMFVGGLGGSPGMIAKTPQVLFDYLKRYKLGCHYKILVTMLYDYVKYLEGGLVTPIMRLNLENLDSRNVGESYPIFSIVNDHPLHCPEGTQDMSVFKLDHNSRRSRVIYEILSRSPFVCDRTDVEVKFMKSSKKLEDLYGIGLGKRDRDESETGDEGSSYMVSVRSRTREKVDYITERYGLLQKNWDARKLYLDKSVLYFKDWEGFLPEMCTESLEGKKLYFNLYPAEGFPLLSEIEEVPFTPSRLRDGTDIGILVDYLRNKDIHSKEERDRLELAIKFYVSKKDSREPLTDIPEEHIHSILDFYADYPTKVSDDELLVLRASTVDNPKILITRDFGLIKRFQQKYPTSIAVNPFFVELLIPKIAETGLYQSGDSARQWLQEIEDCVRDGLMANRTFGLVMADTRNTLQRCLSLHQWINSPLTPEQWHDTIYVDTANVFISIKNYERISINTLSDIVQENGINEVGYAYSFPPVMRADWYKEPHGEHGVFPQTFFGPLKFFQLLVPKKFRRKILKLEWIKGRDLRTIASYFNRSFVSVQDSFRSSTSESYEESGATLENERTVSRSYSRNSRFGSRE